MKKTPIDNLAPWEILSEKTEIDNQWLKIRNVTFRLPNDKVMKDYFIAEKAHIAVIIPLQKNKTYLMQEYERGVEEIGHKFPAGRIDEGEIPEEGAKRELLEELGFEATNLTFLGETYVDPGFMTTRVFYFLCTEFKEVPEKKDNSPFELFEGEWVDFAKVGDMIQSNEIKNPHVIAGYCFASQHIAHKD